MLFRSFFKNIGITSKDIGLKVNSRKVMGAVLKSMGVTNEQFAPVCVVMDKFDKIGPEETQKELRDTQGLDADTAKKLVDCLLCKSVDDLAALKKLKPGGEATSLARAVAAASQAAPDKDLAAIVMLSDGVHNAAGDPVDAAELIGVNVHTIEIGRAHV